MRTRAISLFTLSAILAVTWSSTAGGHAASGKPSGGSNAVIEWNANAGDAALAACIAPGDDPLHEARMYAMTHIAIHDALNAIKLRSEPYAFHPRHRVPSASPEAAVASAARNTLVPLIQGLPPEFDGCKGAGVASVEADYAAALAAIRNGNAKQRGIELGQAAAAAILHLRARRRLRSAAPGRAITRKETIRVSTASRRARRSSSCRRGVTSRRSCCGTAPSSCPVRRTPSTARTTRPTSTR